MAEEIQLRIVTPRRPVLDEPVLEVTAPGTLGEFGVLPNHAAFLTSLEPGRLSYRDARGVVHNLAISGGFAEVANNVMTVLVDAAEPAPEIDVPRARADLAATEARLTQLAPNDPEFAAAEAERRWATARIEAAKWARNQVGVTSIRQGLGTAASFSTDPRSVSGDQGLPFIGARFPRSAGTWSRQRGALSRSAQSRRAARPRARHQAGKRRARRVTYKPSSVFSASSRVW